MVPPLMTLLDMPYSLPRCRRSASASARASVDVDVDRLRPHNHVAPRRAMSAPPEGVREAAPELPPAGARRGMRAVESPGRRVHASPTYPAAASPAERPRAHRSRTVVAARVASRAWPRPRRRRSSFGTRRRGGSRQTQLPEPTVQHPTRARPSDDHAKTARPHAPSNAEPAPPRQSPSPQRRSTGRPPVALPAICYKNGATPSHALQPDLPSGHLSPDDLRRLQHRVEEHVRALLRPLRRDLLGLVVARGRRRRGTSPSSPAPPSPPSRRRGPAPETMSRCE